MLVFLNNIIITVWKRFKGEFKIMVLLYICFWIDNAHEHHYQFENLLLLYLNTAIHLLFSKINSKDITSTVQQSVSKYFDVLSKNTQLLHVCLAWEGVGYSLLYGYSILPSYPGTNCTCTIHVTATNQPISGSTS